MTIDLDRVIRSLRSQLEAFRAIYRDVTDEESSWRPADGGWSLLEILGHLADEEREDFRQRIDFTLHRPDDDWPPIDPEGWVGERDYAGRSLSDTWKDFEAERERSLVWLAQLGDVDWSVIFSALYRAGYDGPIIIEHEDRKFEGSDELVKRVFLLARDVLRPYVK